MTLIASESVLIHKKADEIFEYISNMETFSEWFKGAISIESVDDAEHGSLGKSYLETVKVPLLGTRKITLTVVESEKPVKFVTEAGLTQII